MWRMISLVPKANGKEEMKKSLEAITGFSIFELNS